MRKCSWAMAASFFRMCFFLGLSGVAAAQTQVDTLFKVRHSGKFVIGTRDSSAPLAYTLGNGRYIGYHIDICSTIVENVRRRLRMPNMGVEYVMVTPQNRLALLANGTIDLECGSTTNNVGRQREVAFAPTTYITNVRMAVRADSGIGSVKDLAGKTVVTTSGTTSVMLLRKHERATGIEFKPVLGKDHAESFLLVGSGRADVFVMDDNILAGLIATAKSPSDFKVVGETLSEEPIAIMYRRDDPGFKQLVDDTVRGLMKSGELARLYAKWFNAPIPPWQVTIGIPMGASLKFAIRHPNDNPAESYKR